MTGERYRIELEALPAETPPTARLRAALRQFLRAYRLRCTRLEPVTDDGTDQIEDHQRRDEQNR